MAPKKRGRPSEFRDRRSIEVLLDAKEVGALRRRVAAEGMSVSAFVRRLIVRALATPMRRREQ